MQSEHFIFTVSFIKLKVVRVSILFYLCGFGFSFYFAFLSLNSRGVILGILKHTFKKECYVDRGILVGQVRRMKSSSMCILSCTPVQRVSVNQRSPLDRDVT